MLKQKASSMYLHGKRSIKPDKELVRAHHRSKFTRSALRVRSTQGSVPVYLISHRAQEAHEVAYGNEFLGGRICLIMGNPIISSEKLNY